MALRAGGNADGVSADGGALLALDLFALLVTLMAGRVIPAFTGNAVPSAKPRRNPYVEAVAFGTLGVLLVAGPLGPWLPAALILRALWPADAGVPAAAAFCTDALEEALARHGAPAIFNTDQGSQFTSFAFTDRLQAAGIRISMDGHGRCMDNVRPLTRTDGVRGLSHRAAVALAQIRGGPPARDRRRLYGPARDRRVDRLLQRRETAHGTGRVDAGRGLPGRDACGYDGQAAARLAHISTGAAAAARGSIQGDSGGLNINRNTP